MRDSVYRQDAIDAIEEYSDRLQMVNWKENPGVPYKAHALNWCVNTIRDLPSAQQWIPCSERLPKVREWVLCQCRAGIMDVLRLTEDGDWNKDYPHTEYMRSFVIAWMPLPEAYKGEDHG